MPRQNAPIPEPCVNRRTMLCSKPLQGWQIHVIVVVMAEQNQINGRQVFDGNARSMIAPRPSPRYWTSALGPDRICKDIETLELDQERRVIDEGDAQAVRPFRRKRCG